MLSTIVFAVLSSGLFLNGSSGSDCMVSPAPLYDNSVPIVNQCIPVNTSSPIDNEDKYLNGKIDITITFIPEILPEVP